jgi:hypothetical protein
MLPPGPDAAGQNHHGCLGLEWRVKNAGKKEKMTEWKVLLGFAMLLLGIVAMVLSRLQRFNIPGGWLWLLAGLLLLLNGLGVIPRRRG